MVPLRFLFVESPVSLEIADSPQFIHETFVFSLAANHQFCPCSIPGPQDSNRLVPLEVEFKCPLYLKLGLGSEHGTNLGFIKFNLKYYCLHSRFDKSGQFHPETSPRNLPETSQKPPCRPCLQSRYAPGWKPGTGQAKISCMHFFG